MKKLHILFVLIVFASQIEAQELQAKLSLITNKVSKVDKKIFQTLVTKYELNRIFDYEYIRINQLLIIKLL